MEHIETSYASEKEVEDFLDFNQKFKVEIQELLSRFYNSEIYALALLKTAFERLFLHQIKERGISVDLIEKEYKQLINKKSFLKANIYQQ